MNESRSHGGCFKKDRSKKFDFKKKLELIEGRHLASIWNCFVQRSIEESMEIATPDLKIIPLVSLVLLIKIFPDRCQVATFKWFQLFFEDEFFRSVFFKKTVKPSWFVHF